MSVTIKNENYGYSVATYGDYVAIGSPPSFRKNQGFSIGIVNVKKYDSSVDQYVPYLELQKTLNLQQLDVSLDTDQLVDLLTENGDGIDIDLNETDIIKLENEYGNSLSIYTQKLIQKINPSYKPWTQHKKEFYSMRVTLYKMHSTKALIALDGMQIEFFTRK